MRKMAILAILLAAPSLVLAQNLLVDPSFSDPVAITCDQHPPTEAWNSAVWKYWTGSPAWGNKCRRNAETHIPACPRDPLGENDSMRGSISWGEPSQHRIYQTVSVTAGQTYNLTGVWAGGNDTAYAGTFKVEMRDGPNYDSTLLPGSFGGTIPASQAFGWTPFSISGTPTTNQLTVVIYGSAHPSSWGAKTIHVDNLSLTVAPCTTPPTIDEPAPPFTNPTPDHAGRDTSVNVQVKGTNFENGKMTVKLQQVATTITATNVAVPDANTITCTLNLAGAPLGYWDLVVQKANCEPDAILLNAFRIVLPGPNLHNGSFELPTQPGGCPVTPQNTPTEWAFSQFDFYGGSWGYRDENVVYPPSCPPPDGDHYVSTKSTRGGGVTRMTQTITCAPGTAYTLTGMFAGGGGNVSRIALLDGGPDDPLIGETIVYNGGTAPMAYDWMFGYVGGTPTTDIITIRWEVSNTGSGGSDRSAHADKMVLQPCTGSVTITAFSPAAAATGSVLAGAAITGSGFSGGAPVVYLSRSGESIPGTNVSVAGDGLMTCDFDLTDAGPGTYDVIVGNNGCFTTFASAIILASPVLINGEFEDPTAGQNCGPPPLPILGVPTGWNTNQPAEFTRDGSTWYPVPCPCPHSEGGHYGSMSTGFGLELRAWQVLKVTTGKSYRFGGWFAGGGSNTVKIKLIDGTDPMAVPALAETVVAQPSGSQYDWQYSFVQAAAVSDLMTVVWELTGAVDQAPNATHADALTFETPCNDPFADADGDGDVDHLDFAIFQLCYTGANQGPVPTSPEYCKCLDSDGAGGQPDNDIDQGDLTRFEACASGPGVPALVTCDD